MLGIVIRRTSCSVWLIDRLVQLMFIETYPPRILFGGVGIESGETGKIQKLTMTVDKIRD